MASLLCEQFLTTPHLSSRCLTDLAASRAASISSTLANPQTSHRLAASCWILSPRHPPSLFPGTLSMRLSQPTSPFHDVVHPHLFPPCPVCPGKGAFGLFSGARGGHVSSVQSFVSMREHHAVVATAAVVDLKRQNRPMSKNLLLSWQIVLVEMVSHLRLLFVCLNCANPIRRSCKLRILFQAGCIMIC